VTESSSTQSQSTRAKSPSSTVSPAPGGAHPSYAHGYYDRDNAFYVAWDEVSRDRDGFIDWMRRHVLETEDVREYHSSLRAEAAVA